MGVFVDTEEAAVILRRWTGSPRVFVFSQLTERGAVVTLVWVNRQRETASVRFGVRLDQDLSRETVWALGALHDAGLIDPPSEGVYFSL